MLQAPANLPVRPTTDYAKSGLFNILTNRVDFEGLRVLDLFCGTGGISFEFASRGCTSITAVDQHAGCVRFVQETARKLGFEGIRTLKSDVFRFLKQSAQPYDLVFADPPFDLETTDRLPELVLEHGWLAPDGVFVLEHQAKRKIDSPHAAAEVRTYGNCAFSFYPAGTIQA
jgi:16S rRNA (guanine(966)-N(2))-methyltransferase RsmD